VTDPRVRLHRFSAAALDALAVGDLGPADRETDVPLPAAFADADWVPLWRMRSLQVHADQGSTAWVTGAIVDLDLGRCVGRAGFHGPPDERGMVEVGYVVLPEHRRRGYARAALRVMLERAATEPAVRVVRASISPANTASRDLVAQFDFEEVGEQWDPEDGLETVFEVDANVP